jgi:hypothetical protein
MARSQCRRKKSDEEAKKSKKKKKVIGKDSCSQRRLNVWLTRIMKGKTWSVYPNDANQVKQQSFWAYRFVPSA